MPTNARDDDRWQHQPGGTVPPVTQPTPQPPKVPHDAWYVLGEFVDSVSDVSPADLTEPGPERDRMLRRMGKMFLWCVLLVGVIVIIAAIVGFLSYASR